MIWFLIFVALWVVPIAAGTIVDAIQKAVAKPEPKDLDADANALCLCWPANRLTRNSVQVS